ncbi:hypothetical protein ANO11243_017350 [Dothideomycetidae sp. 11243]|nr:hypothetical protein ANO11243_017350 [fungal sp. No.11243]
MAFTSGIDGFFGGFDVFGASSFANHYNQESLASLESQNGCRQRLSSSGIDRQINDFDLFDAGHHSFFTAAPSVSTEEDIACPWDQPITPTETPGMTPGSSPPYLGNWPAWSMQNNNWDPVPPFTETIDWHCSGSGAHGIPGTGADSKHVAFGDLIPGRWGLEYNQLTNQYLPDRIPGFHAGALQLQGGTGLCLPPTGPSCSENTDSFPIGVGFCEPSTLQDCSTMPYRTFADCQQDEVTPTPALRSQKIHAVDLKAPRAEGRLKKTRSPSAPKTTRPSMQKQRREQDELLIQLRKQGLTYQECREKGNFREQASTLRGRMRSLRDPEVAKTRKPRWTPIDTQALIRVVNGFIRAAPPRSRCASRSKRRAAFRGVRIRWCAVAQELRKEKVSYPYGPGSCSKQWCELVQTGQVGENSVLEEG